MVCCLARKGMPQEVTKTPSRTPLFSNCDNRTQTPSNTLVSARVIQTKHASVVGINSGYLKPTAVVKLGT